MLNGAICSTSAYSSATGCCGSAVVRRSYSCDRRVRPAPRRQAMPPSAGARGGRTHPADVARQVARELVAPGHDLIAVALQLPLQRHAGLLGGRHHGHDGQQVRQRGLGRPGGQGLRGDARRAGEATRAGVRPGAAADLVVRGQRVVVVPQKLEWLRHGRHGAGGAANLGREQRGGRKARLVGRGGCEVLDDGVDLVLQRAVLLGLNRACAAPGAQRREQRAERTSAAGDRGRLGRTSSANGSFSSCAGAFAGSPWPSTGWPAAPDALGFASSSRRSDMNPGAAARRE